jgi:hypothetical protein
METRTPPALKPAPGNQDPLNRDTPQSSVFSFLENLPGERLKAGADTTRAKASARATELTLQV